MAGHRLLEQRQAPTLQRRVADRVVQHQPRRIRSVLPDQRPPRPAVGLHDLGQTVAVSPVDDRHQRVVSVEQRPVCDKPLPHGAVLRRHGQQLFTEEHLDHGL
jgi:hypothetical protein